MRPAFSVIFFTVVSGCGYGMLLLLGGMLLTGAALLERNEIVTILAVGGFFAVAGLCASTLHLGQPQRAWRAFSQWRSSWLSREGVAAMASLMIVAACAFWLWANAPVLLGLSGGLLAISALVTVYCTAQIYTSLKTIPAWHNAYVMPGYILFSLLGGAAWFMCVHSLFAMTSASFVLHWMLGVIIILLAALGAALKMIYWRFIDTAPPVTTSESATGLGRFGAVRSVEAPHTEENYLTQEMGFVLARKHAARLRTIALVLIGLVPVILAVAAMVVPPWWVGASAIAAALSITAGLFVERWLFFAQAKHVVMLYYGGTRPQNP